jgi:hypothetical protein
VARFRSRKVTPVSTAFLLWELWMRLPRQQRRWMLLQARRHGPTMVKRAVASARKR